MGSVFRNISKVCCVPTFLATDMNQWRIPSPPSRELSPRKVDVRIGHGHVQTIGQAERLPKLLLTLDHLTVPSIACGVSTSGESSALPPQCGALAAPATDDPAPPVPRYGKALFD